MTEFRAPRGLGPAGKKQWRDGIAILSARGNPEPYLGALEQLCRTVDQLRGAEADVQKRGYTTGKGRLKTRNPSLAVVTRLTPMCTKLMESLGLTPRGEQRLTGHRQPAVGDTPLSKPVEHVTGRTVQVSALEAALCG